MLGEPLARRSSVITRSSGPVTSSAQRLTVAARRERRARPPRTTPNATKYRGLTHRGVRAGDAVGCADACERPSAPGRLPPGLLASVCGPTRGNGPCMRRRPGCSSSHGVRSRMRSSLIGTRSSAGSAAAPARHGSAGACSCVRGRARSRGSGNGERGGVRPRDRAPTASRTSDAATCRRVRPVGLARNRAAPSGRNGSGDTPAPNPAAHLRDECRARRRRDARARCRSRSRSGPSRRAR